MTKANQLLVSAVAHMRVICASFLFMGIGLSVATPCGAEVEAIRVVTKEGAVYLVPAGSPVKFKSNDEGAVASFQGQFTVSGSYRIQYRGDPPKDCEACETTWDAKFKPDRAMARQLPHWTRGPVTELYFQNTDDFLRSILSVKAMNQLKLGEVGVASGRTTLVVDGYIASIDCDTASYSVKFVRMLGQANLRLAQSGASSDTGC
jgi:hypothetical protein